MLESRSSRIAAGFVVLALGAGGVRAAQVCSTTEDPPPACIDGARTAGASAGMIIYRDPVTGALGVPPADVAGQLAPATPPPQPVERMGVTPGGGVLLDHVPMMGMTATVDAAGRVSTRCDDDAAHGGRQP